MEKLFLGFTRPVWYNNEDPNWKYNSRGSAVIISKRSRLYALTSAHASILNGYKPHQMMFPYESGSHQFLPIENISTIETGEEDTDHVDVILSTVSRDFNIEEVSQDSYFDLSWNIAQRCTDHTKYFVAGYPNELNNVDYEMHKRFKLAP
ncbi:hypothetical protein [Luteolibacter soli]